MDIFERYGKGLVLTGRMIPGVRSLISLPAGIKNMGWGSFLFFTIIGTTMWNIILAGGGYYLGEHWERILEWLDSYETVVYVVLGLFVIYWVGRKIYQYFQKTD
jgi:membrane protein DedA with SNARE-associated domain